jgi:2',3'-cyclic-nucleotide 2'-phosphodiesterase / 3'-nucleotidase
MMSREHPGFFTLALALLIAACAPVQHNEPAPHEGDHAVIGVLETTDLHSNVLSYDYFKLAGDPGIGFERTATLIRAARGEFANTLLFDDGDTIQGTMLADHQALVAHPACNEELTIYRAMDALRYDAGTIGNHEFNYGLDYLSQVTGTPFDIDGVATRKCKGPDFPFVLSNVFSAKDGKPLYAPWRVLTRTIRTTSPDGSEHAATIRIGLLGFTPPTIMDWDRRTLAGKVTVLGVVEAAQKYVPEVKQAGADIVIAISHGGINAAPYTPSMENAGWHLAEVPGIDAILLGHSHDVFPNPDDPKSHYAHMADVDNVRGTIHGVPAVMGDYFGKGLGLIDLVLVYRDGHWQVDRAATKSEVHLIRDTTAVDPQIAELAATEHAATIAYVKTPIGHSDRTLSTYFVAAGDTSALAIVNAAQRDYVEKYIAANLPGLAGVPVLTAASPFKAGFGGPNDYTDVPAGALTISNAADLYLYPNTLTAVKIDGSGLRAWLEKSAGWFNRIDPSKRESQELVNRRFPTYNFDVIQGGITYAIDVSKPEGQRVANLRYGGAPVRDAQPFIVVTNNYRASGGGHFPGLDGSNIVISAPDANREVLINYLRAAHDLTHPAQEPNWHFAPLRTNGPVVFTSASGKLALARAAGLDNVALLKDNGDGTAVYSIDLSR